MLTLTAVRVATADDLSQLREVEAASDANFVAVSKQLGIDHAEFPHDQLTGEQRADEPGVVLVIGEPVVGFAHLLQLDGGWHLEQLSVAPAYQRRGVGTSLLRAALGWALERGGRELTLRTFADIPWNGPYYARHGFRALDPDEGPEYLARFRAAEGPLGLERWGRRIAMIRQLRDEPAPIPAVSVIPMRDGADGLEVFVQYRVLTMDFAAGAVVFPGGRIDSVDHHRPAPVAAEVLAEHTRRWAATDAAALSVSPQQAAAVMLATAVREVAEEAGAMVDPALLLPWDNWITPIDCPKRFDVYFFVAPVGEGHEDWRHITTEAHNSAWLPLAELVRAAEAEELLLLPPTRTLVAELAELGSLAAIVAAQPRILPVRHDLIGPRPRPSG